MVWLEPAVQAITVSSLGLSALTGEASFCTDHQRHTEMVTVQRMRDAGLLSPEWDICTIAAPELRAHCRMTVRARGGGWVPHQDTEGQLCLRTHTMVSLKAKLLQTTLRNTHPRT